MLQRILQIVILILITLQTAPSYANEIQWKMSEPHSLFVFMEIMAGEPRLPVEMKKHVESFPEFQKRKNKSLIRDFSKLIHAPDFYIQTGASSADDQPYRQLIRQAILSDTLAQFSTSTRNILNPKSHQELFRILEEIQPAYDKTIWKPHQSALDSQIKKLRAMHDLKGKEIMSSIGVLFGRKNENLDFVVGFYPIIQKEGSTHATSLGLTQSVGLLPDEHDLSGRMGVIVHEFVHYYFNHLPKNLLRAHQTSIEKSRLNTLPMAVQTLDEALPTAVGNGWAVEKINGTNKDPSWYDDEMINTFAHEIYPNVRNYLEANRTLDEAFFSSAWKIFDKKFSGLTSSMEFTMKDIIVFYNASTFERNIFKPSILKFHPNSLTLSSPLTAEENSTLLQENLVATRIFIFSPPEKSSLSKFMNETAEFKHLVKSLEKMKNQEVLQERSIRNIPVILIQTATSQEAKNLILRLQEKNFDPKK